MEGGAPKKNSQRPRKDDRPPRLIWRRDLSPRENVIQSRPNLRSLLRLQLRHTRHESWVVRDCSQTKSSSDTLRWVSGCDSLTVSAAPSGGHNPANQIMFCCLCMCEIISWLIVQRGRTRCARRFPQIWFPGFVNPFANYCCLTAPLPSPRRAALWRSSSEGITPRWRILDVIASIRRRFYSHCEVTRRLPLTSPHDGQLQSAHQSLSMMTLDAQNAAEIAKMSRELRSGGPQQFWGGPRITARLHRFEWSFRTTTFPKWALKPFTSCQ